MNTANPIVMTLDAGGTSLVFSAICNGEEIVSPVTLPTAPHDLELCLHTIRKGFETIQSLLPARPEAISFAFPGPADYEAGIIGDLPNFPAFRNGVALGPYLEDCRRLIPDWKLPEIPSAITICWELPWEQALAGEWSFTAIC